MANYDRFIKRMNEDVYPEECEKKRKELKSVTKNSKPKGKNNGSKM